MLEFLPLEVSYKILSYLPIDEILTCKFVSQHWFSLIDDYRLTSLAVVWNVSLLKNRKWFQTNQLVNCGQPVNRDHFDLLIKFGLDQSLLEKLRQIYIFFSPDDLDDCGFDVRSLNKFPKLIQLGLKNLCSYPIAGTSLNLLLPNLQILEFDCPYFSKHLDLHHKLFVLNAPKLTKAKVYSPLDRKRTIEFIHPTSIEVLECAFYESFIKTFSNLRSLYIDSLDTIDIDFDIASQLPKLTQFQFNIKEGKESVFYTLKDQLQNCRTLKSIHVYGIDLKSIPNLKLNDYGASIDESTVALYAKFKNRLADTLPLIKSVNYSSLEYCGSLPSVRLLTRKLINVEEVVVDRSVKEVANLVELLKEQRITHLNIRSSSLNQSFFNSLPLITPCLEDIFIESAPDKLNGEFLERFNCLREVSVDQELPIDQVKRILEPYDELCIWFLYQAQRHCINHNLGEGEYELIMPNEEIYDFSTFGELANFLYGTDEEHENQPMQ